MGHLGPYADFTFTFSKMEKCLFLGNTIYKYCTYKYDQVLMISQEQAHLYKLVHWNPNSFQHSVFCLFQTSHGCCRRNRSLHLRQDIDPCTQAIFLCMEHSVVGKYLFNRELYQFFIFFTFGFSFA